jgi:uncharacterized protein YjiS (DUF1127 family)
MIARIWRVLSRSGQLAGFIFKATRPGWRAASSQRPSRRLDVARFRPILGRTLVRLVEHVISWDQRVRDRQVLASLDDRMRRDIGIDRATAERDSTTSFWRLR